MGLFDIFGSEINLYGDMLAAVVTGWRSGYGM
jgi:hypothetical protein